MSKSHRDNTQARRKAESRGVAAFSKKTKRRVEKLGRCNVCGTPCRHKKLRGGLCPGCWERSK